MRCNKQYGRWVVLEVGVTATPGIYAHKTNGQKSIRRECNETSRPAIEQNHRKRKVARVSGKVFPEKEPLWLSDPRLAIDSFFCES